MTSLEDLIGWYWFDMHSNQRWHKILDIDNDDDVTFHTRPIDVDQVPEDVREQAYENFDGKKLIIKP